MVVGFGIGMELENKAFLSVFHCRTTSCIGFRVMPLILSKNFWGDTFWSFDLRFATRSFEFKRVHHVVWILLGLSVTFSWKFGVAQQMAEFSPSSWLSCFVPTNSLLLSPAEQRRCGWGCTGATDRGLVASSLPHSLKKHHGTTG